MNPNFLPRKISQNTLIEFMMDLDCWKATLDDSKMQFILFLMYGIVLFPGLAFADSIQPVQYADIAEIMMKKYQINMDGTDFTIFYRFSTVGEGESSDEDHTAQITSIDVNQDRKSLVISLDKINQEDIMSVRFSQELVSSEGKRLTLLIDGKEKGYESSSQDSKSTMIFVLPKDTAQVEIVGTKVIPEFPTSVLALLIVVSSGVILVQKLRKKSSRILAFAQIAEPNRYPTD